MPVTYADINPAFTTKYEQRYNSMLGAIKVSILNPKGIQVDKMSTSLLPNLKKKSHFGNSAKTRHAS